MQVNQGGVSVWYGTPDAPAPAGVISGGGDTSVTIGIEPPNTAAEITVLYRINHGAPHTAVAHPNHQGPAGKQYYRALLTGFKEGDKVEYVALYRAGGHQIPSTPEAESHVVSFTVGPASGSHAAPTHTGAEQHASGVGDLKETLRATLRAAQVLHSSALEDAFIKLYFSHSGDAQSFWQELEKHSEFKPYIRQLQFALQIDLLTSGHLPLIEALLKMPGVTSMQDLAKLDDAVWHDLIAKSGVPRHIPGGAQGNQAQFYAASILATLRAAFPTVTVWRIAAASHDVEPLTAKFLENSPDFEIGSARIEVYAEQHAETAFGGISPEKRTSVIKDVKRLQRLFAVSTSPDVFRALLGTKFDSAHGIAVVPRATFLSQYGHHLGGEAQAVQVHERAQFINARNTHLRTRIQDAIHTPSTRGLGHHSHKEMLRSYAGRKSNVASSLPNLKEGSLKEDLVKRFPNSEELFGSISLCNCEECESAIGPAAYLVDVLDFLGHSKANQQNATPLDVLIGNPEKRIPGRRPDLAFLNLTCANTNTAMPYIDIVNEILETYVALGLRLDGSAARDSAESTSAELDANPQYLNQRAYQIVAQAFLPFTLPFNRPLMVARSYLKQLGSSRHEILKAFLKDQSSATARHILAAEVLGVSSEEFQILTGTAFDPNEKVLSHSAEELYGYSAESSPRNWISELTNVATFLRRTGVSYADLRAVIATLFISPNQPVGRARELLQRAPVSYSLLAGLLKSKLAKPVEALVALESSGIAAHDLGDFLGDNFDRYAKTVVIDDAGTCDPASMKLSHFDGTPLDDREFGRMHRLIRLHRKTGWKIADLDRAIFALGASDTTPELLVQLAYIKQLEERFHIKNLQILLALWAPIEARGKDSLFRSLFLNKAMHRQGAEIDAAFDQEFVDSPVLINPQEMLLPHLPVLQSALRITALDMSLILEDCGFDPETTPLDLQSISALYRRAVLAKALKLKHRDFLALKRLSDQDPFSSPERTLHFAAIADEVAAAGVTPEVLSYVVRHLAIGSGPNEAEPREDIVLRLVQNLRDGLAAIVRDNAIAPDPNGSLTAQKLALLFDSSVVDEIMSIVKGTVNYRASLMVLPAGVIFPPQLSKKVAHDPVAQLLRCRCPLTEADRSTLLSLSNDPAYQAAVGSLYQQPLDLIATMRSFLDPMDAQRKLVTDSPSLGPNFNPIQLDSQGRVTADPAKAQTTAIAVKYDYILKGLLPHLIATLGSALVKKTISDSLKIGDLMARQLLDVFLKSRLDSSKPAAHDLHALQQPGLTGSYDANPDQSGATIRNIDRAVAFDGVRKPLPAGTRSASWSGMIAPPGSGDFEFILRTNGTPKLWIGDKQSPLEVLPSSVPGEWISQRISLKARELYYIRLDVSQLPETNAAVSLLWQSVTVHKSTIPEASLYPASILGAFRETYTLLHKASVVINTLKLTSEEVSFLAQTDRGLPALNLNGLPVVRDKSTAEAIDQQAPLHMGALVRAARFITFRRGLPASDIALTDLFKSPDFDHALHTLASTTGWDPDFVRTLAGVLGFGLALPDFVNENWILRLKNCLQLSQRLGVYPKNLLCWSTLSSDFSTLERVGQDIKKCAQAHYDADTWLTVAKPLNDKLREAQRSALVAYLLPRMGLRDADQLFEYFLIDPEMGTCTETSRISLAHSSVQLFVQRCLMNLEDSGDINSVSPHQIDSDQWEKWRKHYRIWQANCQVLLTPENWMQQGLRDDKTPFFTALEGDLTQQEVTADNVEAAYLNYLEKLQQVARLEIIGTFWQDKDPDTGEEVNTLHVFGRTFHAPHAYFYRTLVNFTTWTPWQEMQVSIEGDHLMPLIWNRRLFVFWPVFSKKTVPPDHSATIDPAKPVHMHDPRSYWQVSLAWTELRHNKWSSKQVSKNAFDMDPAYFVEDDAARYAKYAYSFKTSIAHGDATEPSLVIRCVFHGPTIALVSFPFFPLFAFKETTEVVGAFEIGGCNGESVEAIFGTMPWHNPIAPTGADVEALTYVLHPGRSGLTLTRSAAQQPATFLHGSPTPYRLLYPHQFADYLLQAPLFYQDKQRTFFVSPHEERGPIHQVNSVAHAAFQRHSTAAVARTAAAHHASAAGHSQGHAQHHAQERPAANHASTAGHAQGHSQHHAQGHSPAAAGGSRPPRHGAPAEVSQALLALEKRLVDIGDPYSKHVSGRRSAWDSHALGHNAHPTTTTKVKFETFYHPFVCHFMKSLTRLGIRGLLTEANQQLAADRNHFAEQYRPTDHVTHPLPVEAVDFDHGPYAIYNQELFFHIPDLIAERLLQNRRYEEAIRWLKYIFDPADDAAEEPPPERYWKYVPFKTSHRDGIQQLLGLMESGDENHSQLIADWAQHPFRPYAIARHRPEAYKKNIFMKYVRTLIEHGDTLFLSDSKEAINEAQQLYIMAGHLLGPRPEKIPPQTRPRPECYASLRGKLDTFAEAMVLLENEYPFSGKMTGHAKADSGGMQSLSRTLYFCAPRNTKLFELWDVVEDRLYKIRNCLNIQGVFRQLALFDPAIDPGLLVQAAAGGADLGSVMSDLQSPLPPYRFSYMLQRSLEMCNECRSFGAALLSALEKHDAEELAVMRAKHEVGILDLIQRVKIRQVDEANAQIDALNASRNTAVQRYAYYQTLIGVSGTAPTPGAAVPLVTVPSQPAMDVFGIQLIPEEAAELVLSTAASVVQTVAGGTQAVAAILHALPQFGVHFQPFGPGASATEGGIQLGAAGEALAATIRSSAEILSAAASLSGKMGAYFRRQAEWTLQNNLAACEIMQIDRQIAAANIRAEIAQRELDSHQKQVENAKTVLDYMANQKFTSQDLYGWMVRDISSSYFACYQMAFAMAKKAERTFQFERGLTSSSFIQFGYWDSLRKGLLAGDRLHLALLQMQSAYADQNTRDYEISRDISLLLLDPLALIALKETGMCEVELHESFWDADYPGQYMRRIKSVALSVPCVVGPYTSMNCRLTLLANKIRASNSVGDQYAENIEDGDDRFINNFAAVQSIATSHNLSDGGLFEINFHDERYLPFEGAGVVSRWRLEMPPENNAFDFETISDVILHLKYTAREGGDPLRQAARHALASGPQDDLVRFFSARHEFPAEWHAFLNPTETVENQFLSLNLTVERFPFRYRGKAISINRVDLFLRFKDVHDAQTYLQDGTPLGDYVAGKPLAVGVTPPGSPAVSTQLKSDKSLFNGLPHASADVSDQVHGLGKWTIEVHNEDISKLPVSLRADGGPGRFYRLNASAIADMLILFHYSIA